MLMFSLQEAPASQEKQSLSHPKAKTRTAALHTRVSLVAAAAEKLAGCP